MELERYMDKQGEGENVASVGHLKSGNLKNVEVEIMWKPQSVPFTLRRVLMEELAAANHKSLLENAVHAVLLDSGFVRLEDGSYTLPEIPVQNQQLGGAACSIERVGLTFQSMGPFVIVYGYLIGRGESVYRVSLEAHKVATMAEFVLASRTNVNDIVKAGLLETQETQVHDFWNSVKDGIAFPLKIDLCEKAGLPSPPCLMSLPPELMSKIFKSLSGADIARVECSCWELRQLADHELWWNKLSNEFPGSWNNSEYDFDDHDHHDTVGDTIWCKTIYGKNWRQQHRPQQIAMPMAWGSTYPHFRPLLPPPPPGPLYPTGMTYPSIP